MTKTEERKTQRAERLAVQKTYKLFIGGAFPRSESGRTYEVDGVNVARASRKDLRDAVRIARRAGIAWSGMTAYNRGQVLYRLAEMMETRQSELSAHCTGAAASRAHLTSRARARRWEHRGRDRLGEASARRHRARGVRGHFGCAARSREHPHRLPSRARPGARRAHGRRGARPLGCGRRCRRAREARC